MATYQEILLKDLDNQLKYLNVAEYHKLGHKGQGLTVLNTEPLDRHGQMTSGVLLDYAPELNIINSAIGYSVSGNKINNIYIRLNEKNIPFEEAIDKFNIKLITTSMAGITSQVVLDYFKDVQKRKGIIMFCSAGNDGKNGVTGKYTKNDTAITVGSVRLENGVVKFNEYSSQGDEVDFVMFTGRGTGTSAASPALASMVALLLQRYGNFNQAECVEILKSMRMDLGQPGKDPKYGWGLPILPLTVKLEILEQLRGGEEMTQFKDVDETRWSKEAIDFCVEKGLLVGFEDGTFRPTEFVTREQFAAILQRLLNL